MYTGILDDLSVIHAEKRYSYFGISVQNNHMMDDLRA